MRGLGSWRQLRLGLALMVFALTLAVLIGGQGLAENFRVSRPLAREMKTIAGIRRFAVTKEAKGTRLELTLDRVSDLEQVIGKATAAVGGRQQEPITEIVIHDNRQGLESAYYSLQFSLEEALATGRYTKLKDDLEQLAGQHRLDRARIYLGPRYICVQLEKKAAYLYQALPRPGNDSRRVIREVGSMWRKSLA